MANEQDKAAEDELVTIVGGVDLEVRYQNNGDRPEVVKVRQIPISKIPDFLLSMGDEAHSIELYCDRPKGWADTLTVESANAVANKGQEINYPFLQAWWRRQATWRKMQEAWVVDAGKKLPETQSASASSARQSPTTTT